MGSNHTKSPTPMLDNLVSIIIPVKNAMPYLAKCISTVLNQTYTNIEILVIDDKSDDNSIYYLNSIDDKRLKVLNNDNPGVSNARNLGLEEAQGEYIAFVDADDWISETYIEEALRILEEYEADLTLGITTRVYSDGSHIELLEGFGNDPIIYQGNALRNYLYKVVGYIVMGAPELNNYHAAGVCCRLFKSESIKEVRFKCDLSNGEDTIFNISSFSNINKIVIAPKPWYFYRQNDESVTHRYNPNGDSDARRLIEALFSLNKYEDCLLDFYIRCRALRQLYLMVICNSYKCPDRELIISNLKAAWKDGYWQGILKNLNFSKATVTPFSKLAVYLFLKGWFRLLGYLMNARDFHNHIVAKQ